MHPAPSVILFTALSGLGFGMLASLGLGNPDVTGLSAFIFFALAFALTIGGLLASVFHLGNPKNAIKAFSQWRSSWLSREGILSVLALSIMGIYAIGAIFLGVRWHVLGATGAILSVATVFTTSMIYTQLKSIPRWNHWNTPVLFLSLTIAGGALMTGQVRCAIAALIIAGVIQIVTWYMGDRRFAARASTIGTATGLGDIGQVRMFEPPHTGTNYLLSEMVYVVGRKHGQKLRVIALGLMVVLPVILLCLSQDHFTGAIAVISHLIGVFVSRWLFFAQAEHVVGLYYGQR
ncbi:DMSO reductase [Amylibacter marinus]|uniref:DMSO reductase n=1 Tax=Amylibacter marinus TaxID=1475483 RepID=A0ABQ5VR07_9RHOB|nr:DmsC/YnfH family molybdoenzyme membrane anchor subunit [Amylibacter marinus]GLQ33848.1 DMSO reductase [Amylibacter marinus]